MLAHRDEKSIGIYVIATVDYTATPFEDLIISRSILLNYGLMSNIYGSGKDRRSMITDHASATGQMIQLRKCEKIFQMDVGR